MAARLKIRAKMESDTLRPSLSVTGAHINAPTHEPRRSDEVIHPLRFVTALLDMVLKSKYALNGTMARTPEMLEVLNPVLLLAEFSAEYAMQEYLPWRPPENDRMKQYQTILKEMTSLGVLANGFLFIRGMRMVVDYPDSTKECPTKLLLFRS